MASLNAPAWDSDRLRTGPTFPRWQETWHLKVNDPSGNRALLLRFVILISRNGFRRVAETWAVHFQRADATREMTKLALRQSHDLSAFQASSHAGGSRISIGDSSLDGTSTRGQVQSKGRTIAWDLQFTSAGATFNLIPEGLAKAGLVRNSAVTVSEDLRVSGKVTIDGETTEWTGAVGMQGHLSGPRLAHSWAWGHCNSFVTEKGEPAPFIFEGLIGRVPLVGPTRSPRLSSFYFFHQGTHHRFNSIWDALRVRSSQTLTEWEFQADRGDLSFRGQLQAELKDFAGLTYEDTNGSLIFCSLSQLSNLRVQVYRRGKIEESFHARGTATFEIAARDKNPYVPLLV